MSNSEEKQFFGICTVKCSRCEQRTVTSHANNKNLERKLVLWSTHIVEDSTVQSKRHNHKAPSNPLHVFQSRSDDFYHVVTSIAAVCVSSLTFFRLIFIDVRNKLISGSFDSACMSLHRFFPHATNICCSERRWPFVRVVQFLFLCYFYKFAEECANWDSLAR